jgi:glucan 1,3-beta-glucosidase
MKKDRSFKLTSVTLLIGAFIIVGISKNEVFAINCDPNCIEPDFYVHGICFSPYKDNQQPGDPILLEQIQERLEIITQKNHTGWIRTYGATNGLENIAAEANGLGLKVAMGTWIRHFMEDEIDNLIAAAQSGFVDIVVVGNEEIYAYEENYPDVLDPSVYLTVLADVRSRLDDAKAFCTLKHPQHIAAVDMVLVNIYPFHNGTHINVALDDLALRYNCAAEAITAVDPNKVLIIGETGWPSDGLSKGDAEPSLVNLARYFFEVSKWAEDNGVPIFYFAAFDEKHKAPPELEAHWGIWDSDGLLKNSFVTEPVLCETFDPPPEIHDFWIRKENSSVTDPDIQPSDPCSVSDGQFLRLLYDGNQSHFSAIAFPRVAIGAFSRIIAEFDFRFDSQDIDDDADGFAFMLLPTVLNGTSGTSIYSHAGFFAEQPSLPKTFAVGFEIYQWPPGQPCNNIYVSWDGKWFPDDQPIPVSVDLDSGNWHRAKIDLRNFDTDKAMVTIILTPDIHTPTPGDPVIIDNLEINDSNHPYNSYENRVEFVGRNGYLDVNADIDNVFVRWKTSICDSLKGDTNNDCRIDLFDLVLMANNWLIDCNLNPDDSGCVSE